VPATAAASIRSAALRDFPRGLRRRSRDAALSTRAGARGARPLYALEDALVLAESVKRESSLRGCARPLRISALAPDQDIQQRSLLMGYVGQWQNPLFVTGRGLVTRMLPAGLVERNLRRVYSYET
jgi:hypothetical protein